MTGNKITDKSLKHLTNSRILKKLKWLDLRKTDIAADGMRFLVTSELFPHI